MLRDERARGRTEMTTERCPYDCLDGMMLSSAHLPCSWPGHTTPTPETPGENPLTVIRHLHAENAELRRERDAAREKFDSLWERKRALTDRAERAEAALREIASLNADRYYGSMWEDVRAIARAALTPTEDERCLRCGGKPDDPNVTGYDSLNRPMLCQNDIHAT